MSLPTVEQLEAVYADLLGVAKKCVQDYVDKDEPLEEKEIRSVEVLSKVLANAIEHVSKKPTKNTYAEVSVEDLAKDFE